MKRVSSNFFPVSGFRKTAITWFTREIMCFLVLHSKFVFEILSSMRHRLKNLWKCFSIKKVTSIFFYLIYFFLIKGDNYKINGSIDRSQQWKIFLYNSNLHSGNDVITKSKIGDIVWLCLSEQQVFYL